MKTLLILTMFVIPQIASANFYFDCYETGDGKRTDNQVPIELSFAMDNAYVTFNDGSKESFSINHDFKKTNGLLQYVATWKSYPITQNDHSCVYLNPSVKWGGHLLYDRYMGVVMQLAKNDSDPIEKSKQYVCFLKEP